MRELVSSLLEAAGAVVVAVGAAMVYLPAGVIVAGSYLFAIGYAGGAE